MTPTDTACATAFAALLPGIGTLAGLTPADLWRVLASHLPSRIRDDIAPLLDDHDLQKHIADAAAIAVGTDKTASDETNLRPLFATIHLDEKQPAGNGELGGVLKCMLPQTNP